MRKIITFLFFISLFSTDICFPQSYNWKSLSARRNLVSILFISSTEGWIYGGDIVYKTTDGGVTWSYPLKLNYKIGGTTYYSGHRSPRLMYFNDSLKGWAAQYTNILLKTINGGNSW